MWTPRRIFLVVAGLLVFSGGYAVYAHILGWLDGLPPLPEVYTHEMVDRSDIPEIAIGDRPIDTRLKIAFGPACVEVHYKLKFEAREKGLLFAATDYKQMDDGRVQLDQVSVAIFGKNSRDISTVHADRAYITCDKPIKKIEDMGARKIVAAELHADPDYATHDVRKGQVHITNNRKTYDPADDILVKSPGPIYYLDEPKPAEPHIWSFTHVEVSDNQNRPTPSDAEVPYLPTTVADGLRVYLTVDPPATAGAPKKAERKNAAGGVSGVERVELDRNVVMNLWTESRNMFGADSGKDAKTKKVEPKDPKAPPPEKVLVRIQTNGPFSYDMIKDKAHFEMPPPRDPNIVEYVTVTRKAKGYNEDTLTCDFLDVQFKRQKPVDPKEKAKTPPAPPPPVDPDKPNSPESEMEIEWIHAWGKNIAMSSDQDSLFANGYDLVYDANIKQTVLKGSPMHAVKDGNLIRAPELILANLDDKEKQHARARGPGQVGMGEIDPKTQEHSRQAHWNDWLVVTKVVEQGRALDLITLTGGASFRDTANEQMLTGRQLKLWLLSRDDADSKKKQAAINPKIAVKKNDTKVDDKKQPLPHRLEAIGDVTTRSVEMIVHKTEYLNVWFKDIEGTGPERLPEPRELTMGKDPIAPPKIVDPKQPTAKKDDLSPKKTPIDPKEKRDPPIEIRYARRIESWVNRTDGRNELDKAHTEGSVVIHQDPTAENEKGVDISGNIVDLEHYLDGNYLIVLGNEQTLGEVHLPEKLSIVGDDIRIDQRDNSSAVKGWGSMRLMSKTDLEGKELEKPTWIDIHWKDSMKLEGPIRFVGFNGSVQAKQNAAKVLCESMQVWLDRPLYLNPKKPPEAAVVKEVVTDVVKNPRDPKDPKAKEDKSPKVVKVLCDQQPGDGRVPPKNLRPVFVEDTELLNGKLIRYQNVQGILVEMDNPRSMMTAIGPGTVRMFQAGAKDPLEEKPMNEKKNDNKKDKKDDKSDEEMKLTWVVFDQRMIAYNKMPKRAIFYSNVEVVHMPAERHDVVINKSDLPPRAMYLKCEESLEVVTRSRMVRDAKGKDVEYKWQEMVAKGNVKIRSDEYDGMAGTVTYSEDKSLVVLTGTEKNPAVLNKLEVKGGERKTFRGGKITYNVKTKDFSIDDSVGGGTN